MTDAIDYGKLSPDNELYPRAASESDNIAP